MFFCKAYGIVWQAIDRSNGEQVAIKRIIDAFRNQKDAQRTCREIVCLRILNEHKNVVKLLNIFRCEIDSDIYLVFDRMEADLHSVYRTRQMKPVHNYYVLYQILYTLEYIHSKNILHRDLKPSNILINQDCQIKLADFGLARNIPRNSTEIKYKIDLTSYVATRWYRAPEILLKRPYSTGVDIWSVGCIAAELFQKSVLFPGTSSMNQIEIIFKKTNLNMHSHELKECCKSRIFLDMISKVKFDKFPKKLINKGPLLKFLTSLLECDPKKRINAKNSLTNKLFNRFKHLAEKCDFKKVDLVQEFEFIEYEKNKNKSVKDYREILYGKILNEKNRLKSQDQNVY